MKNYTLELFRLLRPLALAAGAGSALAAPAPGYNVWFTDGRAAVAANDTGQVLINGYGSAQDQSAVWTNGQVSVLSAPGYLGAVAKGINDQGVVVGAARTSAGGRPVRWDQGNISELAYIGYGGGANGINNSGVITGGVDRQAVKWKNGVMSALPEVEGAYSSIGNAINDQEDVGGGIVHEWSDGAEWPQQPHYEYESGVAKWVGQASTPVVLVPYGVPGGPEGTAINNSGVVVGRVWIESLGSVVAATFKDGVTELLEQNWSGALGVNDAEDVVGYSTLSLLDDSTVATLWSNGVRTDLNDFLSQGQRDAGWRLYLASDVNNKGWIVGSAYNP
ncbi:MAG: hypothetical protein EOP40_07535 [Rubrivivax sp.]|nr:MAG: hypothetical protein EOP40_07535 [Rubrivivax sp.]